MHRSVPWINVCGISTVNMKCVDSGLAVYQKKKKEECNEFVGQFPLHYYKV